MRTAWDTFPMDLKLGLITNLGPLDHGLNFPGSARVLDNFEPSIEGGYKKVLGYEKWNEFQVPGTGLLNGVVATGFTNAIAYRGGVISTSVSKANWVTRLDLSASAGTTFSHDTFNFDGVEKVVMVDGVNKPLFWRSDTQAVTQDTLAPADVAGATRTIVFKSHVFFAKGSILSFTSPFLETDYNTANGAGVINVGSDIVGLVIFREELIIFCRDSIKRLSGNTSTDFQMQPITNKTGAISGDSIQEVGGDIVYLGPDGVRYLSATDRIGDFALERASEAIQANVTREINTAGTFCSTVIRGKNQYRLFRFFESEPLIESRGFLGTMFVNRDTNGFSWATLKNFKVKYADSKQFVSGENIIFASDTAYVYQMEKGFSFDGADIRCDYQSPYMPITDPKIRKTIYRTTTYLKSFGVIDALINLIFDYDVSGTVQPRPVKINTTSAGSFYGSAVYGTSVYSAASAEVFTKNAVGSGFTVSYQISEEGTNPSFQISSVLLEYKSHDRK